MVESLLSGVLLAAIISVFSFIGSVIAIKAELRHIVEDVKKLTEDANEASKAVNKLVVKSELFDARLQRVEDY